MIPSGTAPGIQAPGHSLGTALRILVACEFSGIVRDAFTARGHDAWSCDLIPSEIPGQHRQCDVRDLLDEPWDLMIAHPPCKHLATSGARWFKDKQSEQSDALTFVLSLAHAHIPMIAIENPVGVLSTHWRKPDQYIHPWQFGHGEVKKTGLWLQGLPLLTPTHIVPGRDPICHKTPPGPYQSRIRSRTHLGIAAAMAAQWS